MLARKPYSGPRKLVLAFDIGTTYSGISYCILQPGQIPEIRGVTKFPGEAEGHGGAKVPSILYYDATGNIKAIGSKALDLNVVNDAEEYGWTKAEWWKLHLRPTHLESTHIKDEDIPPLPPGKSAVDVLTDFIKYLFAVAKTYIEERHMGFNWASIENSVEFIFSHPNGWEGLQQQKYREAIVGAGLIPATHKELSCVHMITEGEASLHYCVSSLREKPIHSERQGIVIIDAAGGTIDLSVYSVSFAPVDCKEVAPAECRLQGSVFVTRRAGDLLRKKLEGSSHEEEMDEITRTFDQKTKLGVRSIDEPVYIKIGKPRYDNPRFNIKRGALMMSGKEATDLFEDSIQAIIDAFDQQRKASSTKFTMAFLVGGMGANDFVWARLSSHFRELDINICRPDNDINKAVANGAVIFYIDRAVKSRVARVTYGVSFSPWLDESNPEHHRRKKDWIKCPTGKYMIRGGFFPILLKGEQIDEEREIRHTFTFINRNQDEFGGEQMEIMCYRGNSSNPQWLDVDPSSFSKVGEIKANLRNAANNSYARVGDLGEVYYQVDFDVVVFFGYTELTAQMVWKNKGVEERTPATIVYYDE